MTDATKDFERFSQWREDGTSEQAELGGNYGGAVGINHMVCGVRDMDASHDFYTPRLAP